MMLISLRSALVKTLGLLVAWSITLTATAGTAVVTHLSGVLTAQKANGETKILAAKSAVDEGDLLVSEGKTFARLRFIDGATLVIRPNSRIRLERYRYDKDKPDSDEVTIDLIKGGLRSISGIVGKRNPSRQTTTTASATIGIRGTHYGLLQCQTAQECSDTKTLTGARPKEGLHIDVLEGKIIASNPAGSQEVGAGQFAYVQNVQVPPVLVPPEEGSRVTVPPSMVSDTGDGKTVGRNSNDNKCAVK